MTKSKIEGCLYDWHNKYKLKRQNQDIQYFLRQVSQYKPKNLLVVGAGTGRVAIPLVQSKNIDIVALDIDQSRLKRLVAKTNKPIRIVHEDILKYKTTARFDLIIAPYSTLQLIQPKNMGELFLNIGNILKSNGVFIFDVSTNFNKKTNTEWTLILEKFSEELDHTITEYQKNTVHKSYLSIKEKYLTYPDQLPICEYEEKWYFFNENLLNNAINQANLKVSKIDIGYGKNQSTHRYIYHIRKDNK